MEKQLLLTGAYEVEIAGEKFTMVNELPEEIIKKLADAVEGYYMNDHFQGVENILKFLDGGFCGRVYELGEDYVLKVDKGTYDGTRDGRVMQELQGLPFIPKVYCYSADNTFMVVQRVKGSNVRSYINHKANFSLTGFDMEAHKEKALQFSQGCVERGWIPSDLHNENTMIDNEGNFWVVDVGIFDEVSSWWKKRHLSESAIAENGFPKPSFETLVSHGESVETLTRLGRKAVKLSQKVVEHVVGNIRVDYTGLDLYTTPAPAQKIQQPQPMRAIAFKNCFADLFKTPTWMRTPKPKRIVQMSKVEELIAKKKRKSHDGHPAKRHNRQFKKVEPVKAINW